ncbi:hypothetical protein L218DRAFT_951014 [Marasmius fiardii PR-910]|nr:hypothetical protein L218DRAFT_951014 [Marasmius fiardii PR-910]
MGIGNSLREVAETEQFNSLSEPTVQLAEILHPSFELGESSSEVEGDMKLSQGSGYGAALTANARKKCQTTCRRSKYKLIPFYTRYIALSTSHVRDRFGFNILSSWSLRQVKASGVVGGAVLTKDIHLVGKVWSSIQTLQVIQFKESWPTKMYKVIGDHQIAKVFDANTTGFEQDHLGYPR